MTPRVLTLCILLIALVSPAFAIGGGGGAVCGRCEIPYPDHYVYADSSGMSMTPSEAGSFCFDRLDTLPFGMEYGGFVIQWVGTPPDTDEDTGRFYCHACINDLSGGGGVSGGLPIDQVGWIALAAYPGRISGIETLYIEDELYGLGAGYLVTIVDDSEGNDQGAAIVRVDPFTREATVLQRATIPNR